MTDRSQELRSTIQLKEFLAMTTTKESSAMTRQSQKTLLVNIEMVVERARSFFRNDPVKRFVTWQMSERGKIAFGYSNGAWVRKNWDHNGTTLDRALKRVSTGKGKIGLGVLPGNGLIVFDFDKCKGEGYDMS